MRISAVERAEHDIARGDYGLARMRLASYLRSTGYDAALLGRLGRICADMRDVASAGRYWLASDAVGEDVETAVECFIRRCGAAPTKVVAQLPLFVRLDALADYSAVAQDRIRRLSLGELILRNRQLASGTFRLTFWDRMQIVVGYVILLLLIATSIVGCWQVVSWII